mmetsp:Transcript_19276/g.32198  ORF Transcript_19276/g.32198 Transcript_19276/m.32198 type:complete len:83 (+) Transcript_19276:891-1139(+)
MWPDSILETVESTESQYSVDENTVSLLFDFAYARLYFELCSMQLTVKFVYSSIAVEPCQGLLAELWLQQVAPQNLHFRVGLE